jgi:hypothetical protein
VFDGKFYVGYQSRAIYDKVKYNDVEKSRYFIFEQTINSNKVILAEGPISALKFAKTGIGFVASMGKHISDTQVDKLIKLGIDTLYLALDRDAYKEIEGFYIKYGTKFKKIYYIDIPSGKDDFGDCDFNMCVDAFDNATILNRMSFLPDFYE